MSSRTPQQILQTIKRLQAQAEAETLEQAKRLGMLSALRSELSEKYEVETLSEAKEKLSKMEQRATLLESRLNKKLDELESMLEKHGPL